MFTVVYYRTADHAIAELKHLGMLNHSEALLRRALNHYGEGGVIAQGKTLKIIIDDQARLRDCGIAASA
jgi:hypothetical protein